MTARLQEALELLRRFAGTPYESAAVAYMRSQVEQARFHRSHANLRDPD